MKCVFQHRLEGVHVCTVMSQLLWLSGTPFTEKLAERIESIAAVAHKPLREREQGKERHPPSNSPLESGKGINSKQLG